MSGKRYRGLMFLIWICIVTLFIFINFATLKTAS